MKYLKFSIEVRPTKKGVYLLSGGGRRCPDMYSHWDGKRWGKPSFFPSLARTYADAHDYALSMRGDVRDIGYTHWSGISKKDHKRLTNFRKSLQ